MGDKSLERSDLNSWKSLLILVMTRSSSYVLLEMGQVTAWGVSLNTVCTIQHMRSVICDIYASYLRNYTIGYPQRYRARAGRTSCT